MTLREFTEADLPAVSQLIHGTIDACYPQVYPTRAVEFFKRFHSEEGILQRAARGHVVVIEEGGAIVATGALLGGEIMGVFVSPDHQGIGLGAEIMNELEARAAAGGFAALHLSVSLPSRAFYEARGYRILEERSLDVGEGQRLDYWEAEKAVGGGPTWG